jgi:hypothetical protein
MTIDRTLKIGIISGLVSMILFVIFIQPILSVSGRVIMKVGTRLYSSFVDQLYEKAALAEPQRPAYELEVFFLATNVGIFTGVYLSIIRLCLRARRQNKQVPKPSPLFLSRKWLIAITTALAIFYFCVIMILWSSRFNMITTASFQQHLHIISPYLTENEEKLIWSQWAQMKSRADYLRIYERLNDVATKNNLSLPNNPTNTSKKT